MRKLYCESCDNVVRTKEAFDSKRKCPDCGARLLICIKGSRHLESKLPDGIQKVSRRVRATRKDGSRKGNFAKALNLPNASDINQMSTDEIQQHLQGLRQLQMTNLGLVKSKKFPLERPDVIPKTRATIARMLTVLHQRGVKEEPWKSSETPLEKPTTKL